ncbi:hypothetical protein EN45_038440 [Penicillium chrysogenum]|uniref:Uncharacterized protein n=1 Tax=Penicillium chrysogenum TaxID=5076 RepID=A0A167Y7H0_PENCH|nr:uncharacterized protein N7525_010654 [Penicillium rubens]KAJ5036333.1 hypothetical protein NUH16_004206 [Penicillium rubens]KAJ5821370.1 hypothetical protein N7525_010654 [Penicillium rubens]KAJ5859016.1 hypothetical protein N7534_004293 [Penicillium rubens]KZN93660.1 hypothetical protein EN45_038440 [Penicillium chrysogenum]
MVNIRRFWLSSSLILSLLAQQGLSIVFEDTDAPGAVNSLLERGDTSNEDAAYSVFDRLSKDSYYWSASQNGHKTLANLTVDVGDDEANIVSMEKFGHLLKSVDCTDNGMVVEFEDTRAFGYTQRGWQWVNDDDDRKLILVMGSKQCGWNSHRTPFIVSSIAFDKPSLKAKLSGVVTDWKRLFRNYEITVGKAPESSTSRRDWDSEASLSFNHKIPLSQSIPIPGGDLSVDISCEGCETKGSFDFGVHIKTTYGTPKSASITLSPNGVSASLTPRLGLSGNITNEIADEFELISIPVQGISIPGGVLELGPEVVFSFGYQIGPVRGSAGISSGVTLSLEDSAELEIDFLSPDVSAGGWTPQVETEPMEMDAKIEAGAEIYTKAEVQFSASILDQGYEAGVNLKPYLGANIAVSTDKGLGVDVNLGADLGAHIAAGGTKACLTPRAGVSLNVDIAEVDTPEDPVIEKTIAEVTAPMSPSCFNFGPGGSVSLGAGKNHPTSTRKPSPISSVKYTPTTSTTKYTSSNPTTTSSSIPQSSSATPTPSHRRRSHRQYHAMRGH